MSAWRKAAIEAFPEAKQELLALDRVEEVWPLLEGRLASAVKENKREVLEQFLEFANWVLVPRPGSRPGGLLSSLTGPVIEFIVKHAELLFQGRSRQDFFRIQPGLRYHLSPDEMKVFDTFLRSTPKYVQ